MELTLTPPDEARSSFRFTKILHWVKTPWRPRYFRFIFHAMKTNGKKKALTFGEFIASVYDACGKRKARGIVRLAIETRWIEFRGRQRIVIS